MQQFVCKISTWLITVEKATAFCFLVAELQGELHRIWNSTNRFPDILLGIKKQFGGGGGDGEDLERGHPVRKMSVCVGGWAFLPVAFPPLEKLGGERKMLLVPSNAGEDCCVCGRCKNGVGSWPLCPIWLAMERKTMPD